MACTRNSKLKLHRVLKKVSFHIHWQ